MGSRSAKRKGPRTTIDRVRLSRLWPSAELRRRCVMMFRRAPGGAQVVICVVAVVALWAVINVIYQGARKPTELFFPVSGALYKTPAETWRQYAPVFREHSTGVMTPELLAALAQVEGSGNPVVRTYWRWSFRSEPFEIYRPASSAVGMYQITDGTFAEARRYCIHDHVVAEQGPWNDFDSCWFNSLYLRVVPSDAVELTSAYLDRSIANALTRHRAWSATLRQKQDLAAVIHLCGAGAGDSYVRHGFRLPPGQRCGSHDARIYVARVHTMKAVFARLAAEQSLGISSAQHVISKN
jgi:hypothetical protein